MIKCQEVQYRKLSGDYEARITEVYTEENQFFDPTKSNSTPETLTIVFSVDDTESGEFVEMKQRFVAPVFGGKGLFQQLLDVMGVDPGGEGWEFDEQSLVNQEFMVTIGENKKGYDTVMGVKELTTKPGKPSLKTKQEALDVFKS